jgi:hypothetical protein
MAEGAHDEAGDPTMRTEMALAREASLDERFGRLRRVAGSLGLVGGVLGMVVACAAPVTPSAGPSTPAAAVAASGTPAATTSPSPVGSPAPTPAPTVPPTPSVTTAGPSAEPSGSPSPGDSMVFGRISGVNARQHTVTVDLCMWFDLPDAIEAARQDGNLNPAGGLSNPYYVRDLHESRTYTVDPKATLEMLGWDDAEGHSKLIRVSQAEYFMHWRDGYRIPSDPTAMYPPGAWVSAVYYWLDTAPDGTVTRIEAQFVP